jgi:anti-sigma B factor antagonist
MYRPSPTPSLLKASLVPEPPCLFLDLRGELDLSCVDQVPRDEYAARPDLTTVVIDLGELTFCDLAGLRALLAFGRTHEAQGRTVSVVRATPVVRRLMRLCGVDDRLHVPTPDATAV